MFELILAPEARAFFAAADLPLARKLARCFRQLEQDPRRHNNIKRLSGEFTAGGGRRPNDQRTGINIQRDPASENPGSASAD
jgi:mRNA interferase RelE/StbE